MWPFRKKALTGSSEFLAALRSGDWTPYPMLGGGSQQRIQDAYNACQSANYAWIYTNSPAVRTVIDVIVRNVGQLDLRLYEEIDDAERQPRYDHPAAMSLRYPNEDTASDAFIRSLFTDYLTFDNAYALMLPASGRQLNFEHLPAGQIEIRGSSLFRAEIYRYWRVDGTWIDFTPDQILHWKGENPHDPRIGLSLLDTLRDVIAEDTALRQATVELAQAGLQEPAWVFRPLEAPEWSNDARKGFEEDLTNRLRRRNKMPVVLEEGMEMRSFGVTPKDAEMMSVRRWAIERVAALYGVPLGMVGLADNLEEAQKQFYNDCLPPYCEEFTRFLNQRVLVKVYNWTDGCFAFNLDEKQMSDNRIATLVSASGGPVFTRDESRAKLLLPPLPDGQGEEIITPGNVVVGGKPSPMVMPIQDPNGPPQDGTNPDAADQQTPKPPKALGKAEEFTRIPVLDPSRRRDLDRQHRNIDLSKAAIERHFNRLERQLKGKARESVKARESDWNRWDREFADDLHGAIEQIVEKEGEIYAFKLTGEFDMRQVRNYLRAMAEGAAEAINSTIRQEIEADGLDAALANKQTHVESAGIGLGAGATRWAREEAARQSPGTEHRVKVWIPNTQRHAEFGGDTVPLGSDWPAGFAPGSTPGCACSMAIQ